MGCREWWMILTRHVNNVDVTRDFGRFLRVIKSFADRQTERFWNSLEPGRLPTEIQQRALNKLAMLDQSVDLNDLRIPPSNRLEALKGNLKGKFSIRINQQWRICFRWENGCAYDVSIEDYH